MAEEARECGQMHHEQGKEIKKERSEVIYMTNNKITIDDVKMRESAWRVNLPQAYVEYLLVENGGVPKKKFFPCGHEVCVIERYLGIIPNASEDEFGMYDIDVVLTQVDDRIIVDEDKLGYDIIPIAALFGGDLLCFDYREDKNNPELCVWDHEESDELEPVTYYICEDWNELQEMLK